MTANPAYSKLLVTVAFFIAFVVVAIGIRVHFFFAPCQRPSKAGGSRLAGQSSEGQELEILCLHEHPDELPEQDEQASQLFASSSSGSSRIL